MIEITITINPKLYQRLRRRAMQAKTPVEKLVGDFVATAALMLSDPDLMTPPGRVLRRVAAGLDEHLTIEEIAARNSLRLDTVQAAIVEIHRLGELVQTYDDQP